MTTQIPEHLRYEGRRFVFRGEPLAPYLHSKPPPGRLLKFSSACWRGYIGSWEICDDKLCLVGIKGLIEIGDTREPLSLRHLFEGAPTRVEATWFSGMLRVPLQSATRPDGEPYISRVLQLTIDAGHIVQRALLDNGIPLKVPKLEEEDRGVELGSAACTIFRVPL